MTNEERKISEIDERVRKTICPTFSSDGGASVEGRISKDDFDYLMCSLLAWRLLAKNNGKLAELTPEQWHHTLNKALEEEIEAHMKTRQELDDLKQSILH